MRFALQVCFYQLEKCPETGNTHAQGYLELQTKKRLQWLKDNVSATGHFEKARGSRFANYRYCTKLDSGIEGTFTLVAGRIPTQETDWEEAKAAVKRGELDDPAVPAHLYLTSYRVLKEIASDAKPAVTTVLAELDNYWLWGPTGSGKSYAARHYSDKYFAKPLNKWWDRYNGEDYIILEDFDKSHAHLCQELKIWADRYPFSGEIKCGSTGFIRPQGVIVTSNVAPRDIWDGEHLKAIERRFRVIYVTEDMRDHVFDQDVIEIFDPG